MIKEEEFNNEANVSRVYTKVEDSIHNIKITIGQLDMSNKQVNIRNSSAWKILASINTECLRQKQIVWKFANIILIQKKTTEKYSENKKSTKFLPIIYRVFEKNIKNLFQNTLTNSSHLNTIDHTRALRELMSRVKEYLLPLEQVFKQ